MVISLRLVQLVMILAIFSSASISKAQERCATVPYNKKLHETNAVQETERHFEDWLNKKIENRAHTLNTSRGEAIYQIPVVVHVIHNGESIGNGVNISDAQILSQIKVLNNDFQRLNSDASNTPTEFLPVAGSMSIEFVLAKTTPEGFATNGIVRVQGTKSIWPVSDMYELKSLSYWPAEDYFNIWVTDFGGGYLGLAQFPVSNLEGLENSSLNRLTDGIVIDYKAFGSIDDGAFDLNSAYNKGRTASHETGHFLGLRHIWGDDEGTSNTCSGTDYVIDTPNQDVSTTGCPTGSQSSCSVNKMYSNFLDYTYDACMNLFTKGQIDRMTAVIENSPRRASLLTSPGLQDPIPVAIDLGIKTIVSPQQTLCETSTIPSITITNYGTSTITDVSIRLLINGNPAETLNPIINLASGQSTTLSFNEQTALTTGLSYSFTFEILSVNGGADANSSNNTKTINTKVAFQKSIPFVEDFNTTPSSWTVINGDQLITWANKNAPDANPANRALYMNFYDYEDSEGESDILLTPILDFATTPSAYLAFNVAYALFPGNTDGLRVYVLSGCNNDLYQGDKVYDKSGGNLSTTSSTTSSFSPLNGSQWRTEIINLSSFAGQSQVQLAFVGTNGYGNNLYVDKISVITESEENAKLLKVNRPSPVSCKNVVSPELIIRNESTVNLSSIKVKMSINGGTSQESLFIFDIGPSQETTVTLPEITLEDGLSTLSFELTEPNGLIDSDPSDNNALVKTFVNSETTPIPLRQNFDGSSEGWTIINPTGDENWEPITTNYNQSMYFNAFDNPDIGKEAWLVTPVLDFSRTESASVYFDLSYAYRANTNDLLQILGSIDCGNSYTYSLYAKGGEDLSVANSNSSWEPLNANDWTREYTNLNIFAGESLARIAFVFTNGGGNNLFIDNIEFYASDEPEPNKVQTPYLVYGTDPSTPSYFMITFNLEELSTVEYEITDVMGKSLASATLSNVLNQHFQVDAGRVSTGVYILRLKIGSAYYAERIFLKAN